MKNSLTVNVVELHAVTLAHGETTTHCMYAEVTQAHVSVPLCSALLGNTNKLFL